MKTENELFVNCDNLVKIYKIADLEVVALQGLDLAVSEGDILALVGPSGAGKSTMAAWMSQQGYPILCDDTCVVRFDDRDGPVAFPGFPRLKLWKDTLNALDINSGELQKDYYRPEKYHLSSPERFWMDPVKLKHINTSVAWD